MDNYDLPCTLQWPCHIESKRARECEGVDRERTDVWESMLGLKERIKRAEMMDEHTNDAFDNMELLN